MFIIVGIPILRLFYQNLGWPIILTLGNSIQWIKEEFELGLEISLSGLIFLTVTAHPFIILIKCVIHTHAHTYVCVCVYTNVHTLGRIRIFVSLGETVIRFDMFWNSRLRSASRTKQNWIVPVTRFLSDSRNRHICSVSCLNVNKAISNETSKARQILEERTVESCRWAHIFL